METPPKRLKQARENVEKILLKLLREEKVYCWINKDEVGRTHAGLPQYGYIHFMDEQLCWQLREHDNGFGQQRHQKFIDIIMRGFGGSNPYLQRK